MDNVFKFIGGFIKSPTTLLLGIAALAVLVQVVFGDGAMWGMSNVVKNLTDLINQLGSDGFVGLIATLILWNLLSSK